MFAVFAISETLHFVKMAFLSALGLALLLTASIRANSISDVISKGRVYKGTFEDSRTRFPFMACLVGYSPIFGYETGAGTIITNSFILTSASFTYE